MVEISEKEIKTIFPALKSNNLSMDILSYISGVKAFCIFRALCKKSKEKIKDFAQFLDKVELSRVFTS